MLNEEKMKVNSKIIKEQKLKKQREKKYLAILVNMMNMKILLNNINLKIFKVIKNLT